MSTTIITAESGKRVVGVPLVTEMAGIIWKMEMMMK